MNEEEYQHLFTIIFIRLVNVGMESNERDIEGFVEETQERIVTAERLCRTFENVNQVLLWNSLLTLITG